MLEASTHTAAVEAATHKLSRLLAAHSELGRYVSSQDIVRAKDIFTNLPQLLADNPDWSKRLEYVHKINPDNANLLIVPGLPLVLARYYSETTQIVVPTLAGTLTAMEDLLAPIPHNGTADGFVTFSEPVNPEIIVQYKTHPILYYGRSGYNPRKYFVHAVLAAQSEVFRIDLTQ